MNEYVSDQFGKLPLHEIGITANPFKDPLEELKAKIKFGASKVELGFSGRGKGAEGQTVPDVVGMDAREDIRRLAEENEVELTTHATFSIPPVSGFTGKEFDRTVSENSQMEIRRAIDFAADTTKGGAIVFHLGEWQRPSSEIGEEFEEYEYQRTKLNEKTGKMDLVFINGKPDMIKSSDERNVLLANTETGEVTSLSKKQKYFLSGIEKEDGKFNLDEKRKPVIDPLEHKDVKEYTWESIKLKLSDGKHKADDDEVAKFLLDHNFERQKMKIEGEKAYYKRLAGQGDSAEAKSFLSTINALKQQEAQLEEDKNKYKTVKKVGLQRSAEAISNLGLYAMEKTKVIKKRGTLEKPLYVSPENVFSEQYGYGSAPDEMIDIVKESRKVMSQRLQMKGKSATEANQLAEDHIKATFDMAHLNTHYKYFKGNQKEFKKMDGEKCKKTSKSRCFGTYSHFR